MNMKQIANFYVLLLLLLCLSGCNNPTDVPTFIPTASLSSDYEPDITPQLEQTPKPEPHTYEILASIHKDMPEYHFVAKGLTLSKQEGYSPGYGIVLSVEVYKESGDLFFFEKISDEEDYEDYGDIFGEMMDTMGFHVVDVNFDGYKDMIILESFAGMKGNTKYNCWLWDESEGVFVVSESFGKIYNPSLDSERKCICSRLSGGADVWGGEIYQYVDGEFIMTNRVLADYKGLVETALVNGEMKIVRQVSFAGDRQIVHKEHDYYKNNDFWQLDHPRWYQFGGHHADQWLE